MSLDLTQQMELYQENVIRCLVSAKLLGPEIQRLGCQMQKGLASLNGLTAGTGIIGKSLNFRVRLAWVKVLVLLLSGFFISEPVSLSVAGDKCRLPVNQRQVGASVTTVSRRQA